MQSTENQAPEKGSTTRNEFGAIEVTRRAEIASAAVAAQAKAMIEAKFIMAMNRPRNIEDVRSNILKACQRPAFAKDARYSKPVGGKPVEGPSIRFADESVKIMGNVNVSKSTVYDDEDMRIVHIAVLDLETNTTKSQDVTIKKTVERKQWKGRDVLEMRTNSYGNKVAVVRSTDDEFFSKEENISAKIRRNLELQIIPQDIIEEAQQVAIKTGADEHAKDPDAAKRSVIDGFMKFGVKASDIEVYIGHSMDTVTLTELQSLRNIWVAIDQGDATWQNYVSIADPQDGAETSKSKSLKERLANKAAALPGKIEAPKPEAEPQPEASKPDPKPVLGTAPAEATQATYRIEISGNTEAVADTLKKIHFKPNWNCWFIGGRKKETIGTDMDYILNIKDPTQPGKTVGETGLIEVSVINEMTGEKEV